MKTHSRIKSPRTESKHSRFERGPTDHQRSPRRRLNLLRAALSCVTGLGLVVAVAGGAEAAIKYSLMTGTWNSWTLYNQQHDNWCWAGTTKMAIQRVKGTSPAQCDIVKFAKNSSDCLDGTQALSGLTSTFTNWGVASSYSSVAPTFTALANVTANSGEALVQINWNAGGAHVATVLGTSGTSTLSVYNIKTNSVSSYGTMAMSTFTGGSAALFGSPYSVSVFIGASK